MEISQTNLNKVVDLMTHCDGEDMQWVIGEVGMSEQVQKQLVATESIDVTMYALIDRAARAGMTEIDLRKAEKWFDHLMGLEDLNKANRALIDAQAAFDAAKRRVYASVSNTPTIDKLDVRL